MSCFFFFFLSRFWGFWVFLLGLFYFFKAFGSLLSQLLLCTLLSNVSSVSLSSNHLSSRVRSSISSIYMHLVVALDGPVAFSHPSPINQPKPGSQEQLQLLPSHHLGARDVPSSSQEGNWEEEFHISLRELCKGSLDFGVLREKGKEYPEVERGMERLKKRKKLDEDRDFLWVLTKILSALSIRWKLGIKGVPRLGLELFVGSLVSSWFFFKASPFSTFSLLTRAIFWGCIYNKNPTTHLTRFYHKLCTYL